VFLIAGYETSSTTMTFVLYELARHPEIQQSLRKEILQVLSKHDGKLTYDGIQGMVYLDRVVSGEERKEDKQYYERNKFEIDEKILNLLAAQLYTIINCEVKKIPRILNCHFPRK